MMIVLDAQNEQEPTTVRTNVSLEMAQECARKITATHLTHYGASMMLIWTTNVTIGSIRHQMIVFLLTGPAAVITNLETMMEMEYVIIQTLVLTPMEMECANSYLIRRPLRTL